jgi:hypothetical protein
MSCIAISVCVIGRDRETDDYYITRAVQMLLSYGARLPSIDPSESLTSHTRWYQVLNHLDANDIKKGIDIWNHKPPVLDVSALPMMGIDNNCYKDLYPAYPHNANHCSNCQTAYTLFYRAHSCRLCDLNCCEECSKKRVIVPSSNQV